ncbi:MAG: T9SS type A sorting domain-containing protein [Bacteroidetes bacterium]|nr:T9SS type A sorting domain-containing protein [Bacteroidota bacterium]
MKKHAGILILLLCAVVFHPSVEAADGTTRKINLDGLPPVGDQVVGGSCFAWAAAYYYLSHLQWQEFGWDVNDPAHQCSPAFIYNLTNGGVDNGASEGVNARADAFKVLETMGCATMADMPYDYRTYRAFPSEKAFRNGMRFRTLSTHNITTRTDSGLQVLKDHLVAGNLAVLGIFGFRNFDIINSYDDTYCVSQTSGKRLYWHEVTIIGFDDSMSTADGMGAFRLVNSFGTGWGDNGFFWMSYAAVKAPKTSYGYAMYATDRTGYEPSLTVRVEVRHSDRYDLVFRAGLGDTSTPDTLLTFFDFNPMSLQVGVPYPGSAIVLDITDIGDLLQSDSRNEVFFRIEDNRPGNGHSGGIWSLMIEDLSRELCSSSPNILIPVQDAGVGAEETVVLDYALSPPQSVEVDLDSANGFVQLSWNAPAQSAGLTGYHVYVDGRLIDTTSSASYSHYLSLRGKHYYSISAVFPGGESPAALTDLEWTGPTAYGIPFADSFEDGFAGWQQAGSSGIPSIVVEDPVHEGEHAAGIKTYPGQDNTILARLFDTKEGADVETWFSLGAYADTVGAAGSVFLAQDGMIFGWLFDGAGHPAYAYSTAPNQVEVGGVDSTLTVNLNDWYKQKIRYCDGKIQFMLLDDQWTVLLNRVENIADQGVNQVWLFAQGLEGGWGYYDKFTIRPWTDSDLKHFTPIAPTNQPYALLVSEASVDTAGLEAGDEIAIYDGDLCVGGDIVDGEWPLEMNAWEADSTGLGFAAGNTMHARVWRSQSDVEYETDITFEVGSGTFGDGLYSRVSLTGTVVVSVEEEESTLPMEYAISEPYPNPFNPTTIIDVSVPKQSQLQVTVYNLLGQRVAVLADGHFEAGIHKVRFDADGLSSGVYLIHASVKGEISRVSKVLLVR